MEPKFETEKLRELMADFYTLTRIKIAIYDTKFNKIIVYPQEECEFCTVIRSAGPSLRRCLESDETACCVCNKNNGLYIYVCHAGLLEVAVPIKMNDITLGYIIFGQMNDSDGRLTSKERALALCGGYGFDENLLADAFDRVVCKTETQIKAASKIMESCACYMWISEQIKFVEGNLIYNLTNYINLHLTEDLSVDRLCEIFQISRSALYKITESYLGVGIARYIRRTRVRAAMKMLSQNESVAQAAQKSGFDDYNYFSKIFRRETGRTPSEYKKQYTGPATGAG